MTKYERGGIAIHADCHLTEAEVARIFGAAEECGAACADCVEDGEELAVRYYKPSARPFERIRRITGYLVGTLERFNDAKRGEERDRVKHGMTGGFTRTE